MLEIQQLNLTCNDVGDASVGFDVFYVFSIISLCVMCKYSSYFMLLQIISKV